jgi:hypothetical protein
MGVIFGGDRHMGEHMRDLWQANIYTNELYKGQ